MHLMTLRTKIILLIIALITAGATIFAASYHPKRVETIARPLIRINAYIPLSGPDAHIGMTMKLNAEKILKKASQTARYKYEVYFNDSYTTSIYPDNMAKATISFENAPEPRVILNFSASNTEKFIIHSPYQQVTENFIKDLKNRNIKNIGMITAAQGDYRLLAQTFKNTLPKTYEFNGAVYQPEQKDFNILINLMRNNDTELFLLVGASSDIDNLIKQLHDNGISNFNIATLYSAELSPNISLYENTRSVGSLAGLYDNRLFTETLKILINSYEKNFKKDLLPSEKFISDYIARQHAKNNIITVPSAIKTIKDGKIITLKE